MRTGRRTDRAVATVFFTDMVGSSELAARLGDHGWRELLAIYHRTVEGVVRRGGGRTVDSAGDGLFAVFDSPTRATATACRLTDELHRMGIEVRTGLHTGEVELMGGKVGGIAVHLGARVAAAAGRGEVVVTSTVRDLITGSNVGCVDRGPQTLKGIPGEWRLFVVERTDAVPIDADAVTRAGYGRAQARSQRARTLRIALPLAGILVATAVVATVLAGRHGGPATPTAVVPSGDTVARIDAGTSAFTAAASTGGAGSEPTDVAVDGGSVWVLNYVSRTIVRIDAASGNMTASAGIEGVPTGLAVGAGAVWISTQVGAGGQSGAVLRLNPVTNRIEARIPVGDGVEGIAVTTSPAALWAANTLDDTVTHIDPSTNSITKVISLERRPEAIAAGSGSVWVGGADKTLLQIDPAQDKVVTTVQLRMVPSAIAVGDDAVWVASSADNSATRVEPKTGQVVKAVPTDSGPAGIAVADGAVWVACSVAGRVDRIDPVANVVVAHVAVEGAPLGVAASGAGAWVTVPTQ